MLIEFKKALIVKLIIFGTLLTFQSFGVLAFAQTLEYTITHLTCEATMLKSDSSTLCTASVTNTSSARDPQGLVLFSRAGDGTGEFEDSPYSAHCELSSVGRGSSECSISYRVDRASSNPPSNGEHIIIANYEGDGNLIPSSATDSLIATFRKSEISISCAEDSLLVGQETSCTVQLAATDARFAPSIQSDIDFYFGDSLEPTSCKLLTTELSASCSIKVIPVFAAKELIVRANFSGNDHYLEDSMTQSISVNLRESSFTFHCDQNLDTQVICTATANDISAGIAQPPSGIISISDEDNNMDELFSCHLNAISTTQSECSIEIPTPESKRVMLNAKFQDESNIHLSSENSFEFISSEIPESDAAKVDVQTANSNNSSPNPIRVKKSICESSNCKGNQMPDFLLIFMMLFIPLAYRMFRVTMSL
jgi:hypothetical protein